MRPNRLKDIWQADETALNAWLTVPSAWTAELMAHVGFDALTIDLQHGLADLDTAISMLQAIACTEVVPMARVPWNEPAPIMRLLDAGVYGIICPMINSRAEAEAFVGACLYPPRGYRSYGPIRANLQAKGDYFAHANDTILALAMIETVEAVEDLDQILSVDGLSGVYVGLIDLSISLGLPELGNLNDPGLRQVTDRILAATKARDLVAGIHASSPSQAAQFSEQGFRLITPVNDSALLASAAADTLVKTRNLIR